MINEIKEKIKKVGLESKKYIDDPNHPYHKASGFLKVQIILGYIYVILAVIVNIVVLCYLFKLKLFSAINTIGLYLGFVGAILYFLIALYVLLDVVLFVICIIFLKKLVNKDTSFLLFYHNLCVVCYVLLFISLFFGFIEAIINIICFTIMVVLFTLYYCLSVKVRVYFGGDEFIKVDHYIRFLIDTDDEIDYDNKSFERNSTSKDFSQNANIRNNDSLTTATIQFKDVCSNEDTVKITDSSDLNKTDEEKYSNSNSINLKEINTNSVETNNNEDESIYQNKNANNEHIEKIEVKSFYNNYVNNNDNDKLNDNCNDSKLYDCDVNVIMSGNVNKKTDTANLNASSNKVIYKRVVDESNKYGDNSVNEYDNINNNSLYYEKYENQKKNGNIIFYLFKKLIITVFRVFLLMMLFLLLVNFNNKYRFSDAPISKSIFNVVDEIGNNVISFFNEKATHFIGFIGNNVTQRQNDKQLDNDVSETVYESVPSQQYDDNKDMIVNDFNDLEQSVSKEIIQKNAIKLIESIKKIDLSNAIMSFNEKQNAWNLKFTDKSMAKNSIYIIDYINPITLVACSSTYYFDDKGRMLVGWGIDKNDNYYYFDDDIYNIGKMCTGWKLIDNEYYYFLDNGQLLIDDYTPDGYYVDINGIRLLNNSEISYYESDYSIQENYYNKSTR